MRVVLTAAFVGLAGLLAWLLILWLRSSPGVQLAVLPVTGYDIAFPPVPFSPADVTELTASLPDQHTQILSELQRSATLTGLHDRLQKLLKAPDEVLILYVSAHGVSDAGTPYLLCSDYFRDAAGGGASLKLALPTGGGAKRAPAAEASVLAERGRLPLENVLLQVSQCRAGTKLVLLDCTHIDADPWLGMVVNEFPHLLDGVVKKIDDPHLWVLACCRPLEVSRVSYGKEKRSLFSHFVTEGFRGLADRNGDGHVDMAEFYAYVWDGVAAAVARDGAPGETQRPVLYLGREGKRDSPPDGLFLFRVRRPSGGEEETSEPAAGQAEATPEKAAPPGKKGEAQAGAGGAAGTPAPQGAPSREIIRKLLKEAWEWRDTEQGHAGAGNWSPVDYAPHLWREYQERLLSLEMRYRLGTAWTEGSSVDELRALVASGERDIRPRLAQAKARWFKAEDALARFKSLPDVEEAVKLKNQLVFAAPDYVRWRGRSAITSPDSPVPLDAIASLVGKELPEFIRLLEETFEEGNSPASPSADIQESLRKLAEQKAKLEKLRKEIEVKGLDQEAAKLLKGGPVARIESLLATPLLSANSRMGLLDALDRVSTPPKAAPAAKDRGREGSAWEQERLAGLARQAELEVQLVRLADSDAFPANPKSFVGTWEEFRKLGGQLRGFYRGLPGRIHEAALAKDAGQARLARRLLPLVDARDVIADARNVQPRLEGQLSSIVLPRIAIPQNAGLDVVLDKAKVLKSDATWEPIPVKVTSAAGARVLLTLQYDEGALEIRDREEKLKVLPNVQEEFSLDQKGERTLALEARPRDAARFSRSELTLQFKAGREATPRKIDFSLAPPDVVDLVIERIADKEDKPGTRVAQLPDPASGPGGQVGVITCDVFPNRTTAYAFSLKNLSGKKRKVTVQFWPAREGAIPDRSSAGGPAGAFQPGPDDQSLRGPIEMDLPDNDTAEPIEVQKPKPGEKPEKPEKKEGPEGSKSPAEKPKDASEKPEPGKEAQPPGMDVSHGIACVIRDPAARTSWTRWIRLAPWKPAEYLVPKVSYDGAEGKIKLSLRPARDPGHRPLMSAEDPIKVVWETVQGAEGEAGVKPKRPTARLTSPSGPGADDELMADAPRANRTVRVSLKVDDYPRAFVYDVLCDRNRTVDALDLQAIRIRVPEDGKAFASPLANDLSVEFEVDAPQDAFRQPDEKVEVWLEDKGDPKLATQTKTTFANDRQWIVRWEGIGPQGMVKIGSKVQDFSVPLKTLDTSEAKVDVRVRLLLPKHSVTPKDDKRTIVLDGEPPKIVTFEPHTPIRKGDDIQVPLELSDSMSGIGRIIFGIVKDAKTPLDEKDPTAVLKEITAASVAGKNQFSEVVRVPTKEAKIEPGATYYLAVRVWDRVGHPWQKVEPITVEKAMAVPTVVDTMGTIEGQVYLDRPGNVVDWNKLVVRIEKLGRTAESITDRGRFVFKNVPLGTYKIEVKGIKYSAVKGAAEVTVSAGPAPARAEIVATE